MANSTATVMKVITPGAAGRSSPEGSQVSSANPNLWLCGKDRAHFGLGPVYEAFAKYTQTYIIEFSKV